MPERLELLQGWIAVFERMINILTDAEPNDA